MSYEEENDDLFEEFFRKELFEAFKSKIKSELLERAKSAADELTKVGERWVEDGEAFDDKIKIMFLENAIELLEEIEDYERCAVLVKYKKMLQNK